MRSLLGDQRISWILAAAFAVAFFSFGRWIFFEILGVKLWAQALSFTVILLGSVVLMNRRGFVFSKIAIYCILCLLIAAFADYMRGEILGSVEMLIGSAMLLCLSSLTAREVRYVAVLIVNFSAIFAGTGVVITCLIAAGLVEASTVYVSYTETNDPSAFVGVERQLLIFGMVTPYSSFDYYGFDIHRLVSLTSEPARLAIYFLMPGVIALLLKGWGRLAAVPIFAACLLTNSLSVVGPMIFACGALVVQRFIRRTAKFWVLFSVVSCLVFYCGLLMSGFEMQENIKDLRLSAQDTASDDIFRGSMVVKFASMLHVMDLALSSAPLFSLEQVANGPLPFYVTALGSIVLLPLIFLVPVALFKSPHMLSASYFSIFGWFLILSVWGLSMVFTTAPFFFTPSGVIVTYLTLRIMTSSEQSVRLNKRMALSDVK